MAGENGNGNGAKWPPVTLIVNSLLVVLMGVLGWLFQGQYETTKVINEHVITLKAQRDIDRRDIDRNAQKIDDLIQRIYQKP